MANAQVGLPEGFELESVPKGSEQVQTEVELPEGFELESTPSTPSTPPTFGGDVKNVVKDTLASMEAVGKGVVKGATASIIDLPLSKISTQRLKERGIEPATWVGEFVGSTLPIGKAAKFASLLVNPLKLAKLPATVVEGGIAGMVYASVKGRAEGKDDFTILEDMGVEGLTFAGLNGLFSKALGYLTPLTAKRMKDKVVGDLVKDIEGLKKEDAEKLVEGTLKGEVPEVTVSKGVKLYDAKGGLIPEEKIPTKLKAGKGVKVSPLKPEISTPDVKLPPTLSGAQPRYSFGLKKFQTEFESDIDKALYIISQPKPSKAEAQYMEWLKGATGKNPKELKELGGLVREEIKKSAKIGDPTKPLEVSTTWQSLTTKKVETPLENLTKQGVQLYSGLPVDKVVDIVKGVSGRMGKKVKGLKGEVLEPKDLGFMTSVISDVLSPSNLARVHPSAEKLVDVSISSKMRVEDRFTNIFLRARDNALKGLDENKQLLVAKMLNRFNNVGEIPVEILSRVPRDVLRGFTQMRNRVYDPIARLAGVGKGDGREKIHSYLTKLFDDTKKYAPQQREEIIKSFAQDHNMDYLTVARMMKKGLPEESFFGPLTKERLEHSGDVGRVWDLNFLSDVYIKGAARKMRLDIFLEQSKKSLSEIPERSRIWNLMYDYTNIQRGLPVTTLQRAFVDTNMGFYMTKVLKFEGLRQYISKLGASPVAALVNLTQYTVFDGTMALAKAMREQSVGPLVNFGKGAVAFFHRGGRKLAERAGVTLEVGKGEVPFWDEKGAMNKIARITNYGFELTERYNKTASFTRNYLDMKKSLKGIEGMSEGEIRRLAMEAGIQGAGKTQFFTGNVDKPMGLINPLAANVGRFKTYTIKSLEVIKNMDVYEKASLAFILQGLGGVELIPFMKDLRDSMNEHYPDDTFTKILNGMHKYNLVSGVNEVTGLDLSMRERLSPLLPSFRDVRFDSWGEMVTDIATEMTGPTVKDIRNLIGDIQSGKIDLKDPDWKDILGSKSGSVFNVQVQRTVRSLEESEKKYTEFSRGWPGLELNDNDVMIRGMGLTTTHIEHQREVIQGFKSDVEKAHKKKIGIEDEFVEVNEELMKEKDEGKRLELVKRLGKNMKDMDEFNRVYNEKLGIAITSDTVENVFKNKNTPLAERVGKNEYQRMLLHKELEKWQGGRN